MQAAVKMLCGGDRNGVRHKLNANPHIYAVESEANNRITYVYRDGEFALCYGVYTVILRNDVVKELRDVLVDILGDAK